MLSQKNILQRIDRQLAAHVVRKPLTWFWLKILAFGKACFGLLFYLVFLPANAPAASAKSLTGAGNKAVKVAKKTAAAKAETEEALPTAILGFAKSLLGVPYRSAGKSPRGFDCSGFTGYVFRQFGIGLPASSRTQSVIGEKIALTAARVGDLAFFGHKTKSGKVVVTHAGIVASDSGQALRVIHSASRKGVTVTSCAAGYWKKNLLFVKRVLKTGEDEIRVPSAELAPNDTWMLSLK